MSIAKIKNPPTTPVRRHTVRLRHHFRVRLRHQHRTSVFLKRTIAAQIHAWAAIASFVAVVALAFITHSRGWQHVVMSSIFGFSAVLLFTASAVMHFFSEGYRISKRFERILENIDKFCVHILIAGTYTAVIGIALVDPLRTQMLLSVWLFAAFGIVYTVFYRQLPALLRSRVVYTSQFLIMGWLGVFCFKEMIGSLTQEQVAWAFTGGGTYSIGAVIYALERPKFTKHFGYHEIWHLLVVLGCISFFMVVKLSYV